jgi:hypothetical protein
MLRPQDCPGSDDQRGAARRERSRLLDVATVAVAWMARSLARIEALR